MKPLRILIPTFTTLSVLCTPLFAATIEGKVIDTEGKPVAGIPVTIIQLSRLALLTSQQPELDNLTTGPDGTFTLETKEAQAGMTAEMFQGIVARARIQAKGYALADAMLREGTNTIKLQPPSEIHGTVVDGKGAPIANALVRWRGLQTPEIQDSPIVTVMLSRDLPFLETRSAADGTFTLPGTGAGTKSVLVLEDPRFQQQILVAIPGGEKASLIATPAASLRGRLVTSEGVPIPNASIWVLQNQGDIRNDIRTDAEGRFTIGGLPVTPARLMPRVQNEEWGADFRTVSNLKLGETVDIGDWNLNKSVELTGQMVDQDTGQPATGVSVSAGTFTIKPVAVDAEGRFRIRTQPGPGRLLILTGNTPYLDNNPAFTIPKDVATFDAGKFKLQRGEIVPGTVTAEGADSAAGVRLFAVNESGGMGGFRPSLVEKDGTIKLGPLRPGKHRLQISSSPSWQVLEPKDFTIVPAGQAQPKLAIRLKKLPTMPARGRVVDSKGKGLSNVRLRIQTQVGDNTNIAEQTTDAAGTFKVEDVSLEHAPLLLNIDHDIYELRTTGKAAKGKDNWEFSDTVLTARDATLTGRILGITGKPAGDARVLDSYAASRATAPQTTANTGDFSLPNVAPGEVTILAALGRDFSRTTAKTGAKAEITLQPPGTARPEQLDSLLQSFSGRRITPLLSYRDLVGDEKLLEMAFRLDAIQAGGPVEASVAGENVGSVLANAARRDPAKGALWAYRQLNNYPHLKSRASTIIPIWQALAVHGDDAIRAEIKQALKDRQFPQPGGERNAQNTGEWFALAALSSLLNDTHVDDYMDMGLTFAEVAGKQDMNRLAEDWGRQLAPGGLKLFERLEAEWKPNIRLAALCGGATQLTRFHPDSAAELQKQITALTTDPTVAASDAELDKNGQSWRNSQYSVTRAKAGIASALARTNPEAALSITETMTEGWQAGNAYWQIVDAALAANKTDLAIKAIRAAENKIDFDIRTYLAARIRPVDEKLSDEIFSNLKESALQAWNQPYGASLASYAFYRAPSSPAESRLLLEGEWLRRKNTAGKDDEQSSSQRLPQIAAAMAALDPARALEMLKEAPEQWGSKDQPRAQILAYLLSSSPARDTLRTFSREEY